MQTSITPIRGGDESPFDTIKKTDDQGGEYWSARDLAPLMGYPRYDHFQTPLRRAMKSAEVQGIGVEENFPRSREVSKTRGPGREDVHLTRFAAYLVAMNGDPNKPEVAAAQAYFAVRTRQAEVAAPTIETILSDPDSGIRMLEALKDERAAREASEKRVAELEGPAESWRELASTDGDYSVADAAKILSRAGIDTGQKRLFKQMQQLGWVYRAHDGRRRWAAYQSQRENGRLAMKLNAPFTNARTGQREKSAPTVRVTLKGIEDLRRLIPKMLGRAT